MSSKCCVTVVLAVICLSVILLSLDADAQPTVDDDTSSCSASTLQEVATGLEDTVKEMKDDIKDMKKDMKRLLTSVACEYFMHLVLIRKTIQCTLYTTGVNCPANGH